MTIEAWPFLIGRNKTLGYQTIVSPQFLSEQGLSLLLAESAGGEESEPGTAVYREIRGTAVGDISLIFRVIRPKAQDYNLGGNETLQDQGSRSILLIEGVVIKGRQNQARDVQITLDDLLENHKRVKNIYYTFWHTVDDFEEVLSHPFSLHQSSASDEQIKLLVENPLILYSQSQYKSFGLKGIVVLTIVCILVLGIVISVLLKSLTPPTPNMSLVKQPLISFCSGLMTKKYDLSWDQLSNEIQHNQSENDFKSYFSSDMPMVTSCTYQLGSMHKNTQSATFTIIYKDETFAVPEVSLIQDSQKNWKIATDILAELKGGSLDKDSIGEISVSLRN